MVQGVGFRPFVYRIANEIGVRGWIQNTAAGVTLKVHGSSEQLDQLECKLRTELPPLARLDELTRTDCQASPAHDFAIRPSRDGQATAGVAADTATCADCLHEMRSPNDPRHQHPLINCTNCGPRYTIIRRIPYDRANTTMATFDMCTQCAAEYADPANRRYHAQPVCCPECGPQVRLVDSTGASVECDSIQRSAECLAKGAILAIKGLGGYHLAVRGDLEEAVQRLRQRKRREGKPFALMVANLEIARRYVLLSAQAEVALTSGVRPIVLAPQVPLAEIASGIAPGNSRLGVMLPYTPIQSLLFDNPLLADLPLVMTSANFSNEPLVIDDRDALQRLGTICDHLLVHDRPIERPVDDSVLLDLPGSTPLPIRRARGIVPSSIRLPNSLNDGGDGLAVGGDLKSTLAVVRGNEVILSQHLGDLEEARTFDAYTKAAEDLLSLYEIKPSWVAHDSHPDYFSTRFAAELAAKYNCRLIAVQHHHAHACSLLAEHGEDERILALVCDGTGYGNDGTIWGGELLLCGYHGFKRLARLRPITLAGGDSAAKDIRRSALAVLLDTIGSAVLDGPLAEQIMPDSHERHLVAQMTIAGVNTIESSGAGRLFDAVACLLGLAGRNDFEGQAAQALESCADQARPECDLEAPPIELHPVDGRGELLELDWRPLIRRLVDELSNGMKRENLAAAFHQVLADGLMMAVETASQSTGVRRVGLSGGVFCNARLTERLNAHFCERGYTVLRHQRVPPNDGGLALGQAATARAQRSGDID